MGEACAGGGSDFDGGEEGGGEDLGGSGERVDGL